MFVSLLPPVKKLQKVTGGLMRLASRTKGRREDGIVMQVTMPMATVQMTTFTHISIIGDLIDLQYRQHLTLRDISRPCWHKDNNGKGG